MSVSVLAAHPRPSFAKTATLEVRRRGARRKKRGGACFSLSATPTSPSISKGSGTPTDALSPYAVLLTRPRILRDAHIYRRSTAVLTSGSSPPKDPAPGHASWDVAERRSLDPPSGGRSARSLCGCYPPSTCPSPASTSRPSLCSAGRLMPEAARERFATPPAGTALAPLPRCAFGAGPSRERESGRDVTEIETTVKACVT
jgi:hypothetical protein